LLKVKAQLRDAEVKCNSITPKLERAEEQVKKRITEAMKHGERIETER
jgi:hypothetical protein